MPVPPNAEEALAPHTAILRRIRMAYGCSDDEFRQHLLAPTTALAEWIHTLPGPPGSGFERYGGAVEQGLTHCLFSLQAADGRTFGACHAEVSPPQEQQRWKLACALGGLFHPLHETLGRIEVASPDGHVWPGIATPLLGWLASLEVPKYRFRWTAARLDLARPASYAATRCIAPNVMSFLATGDSRIASDLIGCIGGSLGPHGQVSQVVTRVAASVSAPQRPDAALTPAGLAETLKRLLATSDWLPNSPGGHVWYGEDGLYLLWPDAAVKLLEAMPAAQASSHHALLEALAGCEIIDATPSPLVQIRTPGQAVPRMATRLSDQHPLLGELRHAASPLGFPLRIPASGAVADDTLAPQHVARRADPPGGQPTGIDQGAVSAQSVLDFTGEPMDLTGGLEPSPAVSALSLDTSMIANPRTRDAVDQVVARLERSFDRMLAKRVSGGVFVALTELTGQHGDAGAIVRGLHDAQLLASDGATPDRRVVSERMEGVDLAGVVLRASAFRGYADWADRWDGDHGPQPSKLRCGARISAVGVSRACP